MSLVEARDLDTSPPEWLASDMIPRTGVCLVWGPSTAGKSLVVSVELALDVANGRDFFNHPCVQGTVALCLGEGLYDAGVRKQARLARQARDDMLAVEAVRARDGDEAAEAYAAGLVPFTDDRLYVMPEPFAVPLARISGDLSPSMKQAMSALKRLDGLELVILDALADFTGGISLSNDTSANRVMCGLKEMARQLDCLVLAVAHPDKRGDAMLGAGRLFNAADSVIEVVPDDVSAPGAQKTATLVCRKSKYGPEFESAGYGIEPCEWDEPARDDDGEIIPGETVTIRSATVRMLEQAAPGKPEADRPVPVLPALRDVAVPRKRSGLRPGARLHAVPGPAPAPAAPRSLEGAAALSDARRELVRDLLAPACPDCSRGGGIGCDKMMDPAPLPVGRTLSGPLYCHESRILEAARSQPDPYGWLGTAITTLGGES
jgi:AAA domain-containing protein